MGPGAPSAVPPPPVSVVPDPRAPAAFPSVDTQPKVDPRLPTPNPTGTPVVFNKPGGTSDVQPVAATAPKTKFDVDLHEPKLNDTYESISQEWYNDRGFAAALKAYNRNQQLQGTRFIEVPPIHVLRKQFPGQVGNAAPAGGSGGTPSSTRPIWSGAGSTSDPVPARATGINNRGSFVVPQGGMTLKAIARETLGNEQRWRDLWDLNSQFTDAGAVLPAGTEVKLPSDARRP